jgi:hypothetical protein
MDSVNRQRMVSRKLETSSCLSMGYLGYNTIFIDSSGDKDTISSEFGESVVLP